MSLSNYMYLGPYILVPRVKTLDFVTEPHCSRDDQHPLQHRNQAYCAVCGSPVTREEESRLVTRFPRPDEVGEQWLDELRPAEIDANTLIWLPNHRGYGRRLGDNPQVLCLAELNPAEETARFKARYGPFMAAFREYYRQELTVEYGVITYVS